MNKIILIWIIFSLAVSFSLNAQIKYEKEEQIGAHEVPEKAINFLSGLEIDSKVKWYRELSNDGVSYEFKTKLRKALYSVEFDSVGIIEDVEYTLDFKDLDKEVKKTIIKQLSATFSKYRILKVQRQYSGTAKALHQLIEMQNSKLDHITRYEIVLSGKKKSYRKKYEITADKNGKIENIVHIINPEMNNLIY